ncbi:putative membrane protein [Pullulanibacillus pueri]|uniref:Membrane protein n=1 Tax=Pullulanibacillus pueri TaxID=1437324 RepID=A0A8J2ZT21_9BACL|nr:DUF975 family protein [Pullulanibacillus pueri]MBM7681056.1 putative membrane protein [Pullulanibacillus pueri]GGH76869.1 membrane protein [Pullulanibacillus pueri]
MITELKRKALASLKGRWSFSVLVTLITGFIYLGIPNIATSYINDTGSSPSLYPFYSTADIAMELISFILFPITVGLNWVFLDVSRKKETTIKTLFSPFSDLLYYLKMLGTQLLMGLFIFLWSLLLIIPGIIKSLAYSQTFLVMRDHPEYSVLEAITASRRLMHGYKWKYVLLWLSFIGWGILASLTAGIGMLWLVPYVRTTLGEFYNMISGAQPTNEA